MDPAGLAAWQFGFGMCAGTCGSFTIIASDDGEDVSLGLEFGAGAELSAGVFIGRTTGNPVEKFSWSASGSAGGAYGFGLEGGGSANSLCDNDLYGGILLGLGGGASTTYGISWPVK